MKSEIINLLQTKAHNFNGQQVHGINARHLHQALQVGRDYSTWIRNRIKEASFIEEQDYLLVPDVNILPDENLHSLKRGSANNKQLSKVRVKQGNEYIISVDMAKHLRLMEKNEIGKVIRQHFIEAEKQLKQIAPKVYRNTLAKTQERLASIDRNKEMTEAIKDWEARNHKAQKPHHYSIEQELLDSLVLGMNVRKWKAMKGIKGNVRDYFTTEQLNKLKQLQATNTALINIDMSYHERKAKLTALATRLNQKVA